MRVHAWQSDRLRFVSLRDGVFNAKNDILHDLENEKVGLAIRIQSTETLHIDEGPSILY
jgi:hypothetical protein